MHLLDRVAENRALCKLTLLDNFNSENVVPARTKLIGPATVEALQRVALHSLGNGDICLVAARCDNEKGVLGGEHRSTSDPSPQRPAPRVRVVAQVLPSIQIVHRIKDAEHRRARLRERLHQVLCSSGGQPRNECTRAEHDGPARAGLRDTGNIARTLK
eukprot:620972-Prymnesium_polylepis.3